MPCFLSLPEFSLVPGKPSELGEPVGQTRFVWANLLREPCPAPASPALCMWLYNCRGLSILPGVTLGRKEAFKWLPAVGTAFWMINNIDGGLPVMHEGRLELRGNFAGVLQKGCVRCWQVPEFHSLAAFLINLDLTRLPATSNPVSKEWGNNNNKRKQHALLHMDKRWSFAAHLKLSEAAALLAVVLQTVKFKQKMLRVLDKAYSWSQQWSKAQECDSQLLRSCSTPGR